MATPCAFGMPSQSPVPVGLTPACTPNWGTRAGSTLPLVELEVEVVEVPAEVEAGAAADVAVPARIACACAPKVVAACGHPTPGPKRFWSVIVAALMRASWEACELSVGKDSWTPVLLMAWPAATFAFKSFVIRQ